MAPTWLPINEPERIGDHLETLDAPIAWIGLHLFESLCGPGHRGMILQVTLHIKHILLRGAPSSNGQAEGPAKPARSSLLLGSSPGEDATRSYVPLLPPSGQQHLGLENKTLAEKV